MPRIVCKNIGKDSVKCLSEEMAHELASIIDCPIDWLTFEHIENTIFVLGHDVTDQSAFIEISWFKRDQGTQDQVAKSLYNYLDKNTDKKEITIIFYELSKENYYEGGEHY